MLFFMVILAAIVPVIVAMWYILSKDRMHPEPSKWLIKAFLYGMLSTLLSYVFSSPTDVIFGMDTSGEVELSLFDAFADAFMVAAIPEELAKFIMLWLLLRKNPAFDEKFDGIVYAVCIGMGFAGVENVMYLFDSIDDGSWIGVGVARALFSIPGHFLFAVLMGYYYSLYYWRINRSLKTRLMILGAPILAHGLFDSFLFFMEIDEVLGVIGMVVFLFFFNKLRKKGQQRIEELRNS